MKNILLIGAGRFGRHIAMQLSQLGHQIMAVDTNEERINDILPLVTNAQIGDSTNAEFLRSLGIGNFDVCIVTIGGSFQNSLETTSLLKELGAKCVVSRAERDVHAKFLLRNGADQVVYPEKQVAKWAAIRYTADHIFDYIEIDEQHAIFEVEVPHEWIGKSVSGYERTVKQYERCHFDRWDGSNVPVRMVSDGAAGSLSVRKSETNPIGHNGIRHILVL